MKRPSKQLINEIGRALGYAVAEVNWAAKAEAAEASADWDEAKRCWYYAAQALNGNPHGLRTYYGEREDAAEARRRESVPTLIRGDNQGEKGQ